MKTLQMKVRGGLNSRARSDRVVRKTRYLPLLESLEVRQVPATFTVNTTLDTVAVNLQNGKDSTGHISLRSAIQAADAKPGADTIKLPSGTFTLTIAGANEDAAARGDLDLHGNITITGKGSSKTIIDGNNLDGGIFETFAGKDIISGLTIQHGLAGEGGALFNTGGQVTLTSVVIQQNNAIGSNGKNGSNGSMGVPTGGNGDNGSSGYLGMGGGVLNARGSLTIVNSTIALNQAIGGNGGQGGNGGDGFGASGGPTISGLDAAGGLGGAGGNGAPGLGGGIANLAGASLTIDGCTISGNRAVGGIGGSGR